MHPAHNVTWRQQRRIAQVADLYLQTHPDAPPCWRFDIIAVWRRGGEWALEHVEQAFTPDGGF